MYVDIPTPRSSATTVYRAYLQYVLEHAERILEFYGKDRWSRLRWKSFMGKQKGYDVVCKRITDGNPTTLVAFGDAMFPSSSRGHAASPVKGLYKELKRRCRVIKVDEFRTSQFCSLCDGRFGRWRDIWGLKMCQNTCLVSVITSNRLFLSISCLHSLTDVDALESRHQRCPQHPPSVSAHE